MSTKHVSMDDLEAVAFKHQQSGKQIEFDNAAHTAHYDDNGVHLIADVPEPTVDQLREDWLAKIKVVKGIRDYEANVALSIADAVAGGYEPNPERVKEFRQAKDRLKHARDSRDAACAAFEQAKRDQDAQVSA